MMLDTASPKCSHLNAVTFLRGDAEATHLAFALFSCLD